LVGAASAYGLALFALRPLRLRYLLAPAPEFGAVDRLT